MVHSARLPVCGRRLTPYELLRCAVLCCSALRCSLLRLQRGNSLIPAAGVYGVGCVRTGAIAIVLEVSAQTQTCGERSGGSEARAEMS